MLEGVRKGLWLRGGMDKTASYEPVHWAQQRKATPSYPWHPFLGSHPGTFPYTLLGKADFGKASFQDVLESDGGIAEDNDDAGLMLLWNSVLAEHGFSALQKWGDGTDHA